MASWFYKDGKGKVFGDDICPEGWTDHPDKVYVAPKAPTRTVKSPPKKGTIKSSDIKKAVSKAE